MTVIVNSKFVKRVIYLVFCAFSGAVISSIVWLFLKIMEIGIGFIWEFLPGKIDSPFYTPIVCLIGGLLVGVYQYKTGASPDELENVISKVKSEKFYPYNNVLVVCGAALLPLLFGGSIGPEAGLTGVIVGLCYWAGNSFKFAKEKLTDVVHIGVVSTLSVIFGTPLFGLVMPVEEKTDSGKNTVLPRIPKIVSIAVALLSSLTVFWVLTHFFGGGMSFQSFGEVTITNNERLFGALIIIIGIVFGYLFILFQKISSVFFEKLRQKTNIIFTALLGGVLLGLLGTYLPLTMFSGEKQIEILYESYKDYAPWLLILIGTAKLFITNVCIKSGWKGGHFFPVIFSGVSIGYGVAMLIGINPVFCLGVLTAGMMGVLMRKPVAVSLLLMLCFPVRVFPWLLAAAFLGSIVPLANNKKKTEGKNEKL